jgi:hypothetical protein
MNPVYKIMDCLTSILILSSHIGLDIEVGDAVDWGFGGKNNPLPQEIAGMLRDV